MAAAAAAAAATDCCQLVVLDEEWGSSRRRRRRRRSCTVVFSALAAVLSVMLQVARLYKGSCAAAATDKPCWARLGESFGLLVCPYAVEIGLPVAQGEMKQESTDL